MPDFVILGKWFALAGICLLIAGGLVYLIGRIGGFQQIPGTLHWEGQGVTCIFPVLGSILLSILLTILLNVAGKFIK